MFRRVAFGLAGIGFLLLGTVLAPAQDRRQNAPGAFDFYVLALSWSPSYCETSRERRPDGRADPVQCGPRPFSFVVHGLWLNGVEFFLLRDGSLRSNEGDLLFETKSGIRYTLRLGVRAVGWDSVEIEQWIADRLKERA